MKNLNLLLAGLVVLPLASSIQTAAVPMSLDDRVTQTIQLAAASGRHFAVVDFKDESWKTELSYQDKLRAQGFKVRTCEDQQHYGWENLNGALEIKW